MSLLKFYFAWYLACCPGASSHFLKTLKVTLKIQTPIHLNSLFEDKMQIVIFPSFFLLSSIAVLFGGRGSSPEHHIMAIYKWIILNTENINKRHWDSCEQFGNSKIQFLQWINFLIAVGWMQFYLQWVIDCKMHLGTRVHTYLWYYTTTIAIDWILEENFNKIHCVPHFNHTICNELFTHAEQRRGFNAPTSVIMSHSEAESE